MESTPQTHRAHAPRAVGLAVVTVSDTRTLETDSSGALIVALATAVGHRIVRREIVRDDPGPLQCLVRELAQSHEIDAILVTGGTGISGRDQTFEAVSTLLTRTLPGFGELFRMLSFAEIGPATILSRAVGGLIDDTAVFVMPGSKAAVELACGRIILPELAHVVGEARKT